MPELVKESHVSRIVLEGFKSIAECDLELGKLNVLIGSGLTQLAQAMVREAHRAPKKLHRKHRNIWAF